jgi:hypothetical protein
MGIEQRGNSFRAKVYDGKKLAVQKTFATRAEATAFLKDEKAKIRLGLGQKTLSQGVRLIEKNRAQRAYEALRRFELQQELGLSSEEFRRLELRKGG